MKIWLRAMSGVSRQPGKARRAAATAASTSDSPPRGTRGMAAPVEGSWPGLGCARGTSTDRPPIQWIRIGACEASGLAGTDAWDLESITRSLLAVWSNIGPDD